VRIGRNCYIGCGSMIRQQQVIGEQSLVGMGAVVVKDVPAGAIVVGNPARQRVESRPPHAAALNR
jgi:acetyltransferase-like isoleucine patch superfamily enzyme